MQKENTRDNMFKVVVEYKKLVKETGCDAFEKSVIAEHEVNGGDTDISFREGGTLLIYEKGGRVIGYSPSGYIRFWTEEVEK